MDTQLDLSIVATIKDPDLRASLERLGAVIKNTPQRSEPEPPSSAKIIQFPLFPESTRPVSNDMARSALFSCIQGKPTVSLLITSLLYCHINGFQRASNMEKPWPGGEKRMDGGSVTKRLLARHGSVCSQ